MWEYNYTYYDNELYHYGIPGMKWGHRKALPLVVGGRRSSGNASARMTYKQMSRNANAQVRNAKKQAKSEKAQAKQAYKQSDEYKARQKKAMKAGAAAAGTALAAYGAYKLNKYVKTKNCQIAAQRGFDLAEKNFNNTVSSVNSNLHSMTKGAKSYRYEINANSGLKAREAANNAANDSFRTAARNVVNYKKSSGRRLGSLNSVDFLSSLSGSSTVFEKKRR